MDIISEISNFLKHPLVISIVSILLGSFLLNTLNSIKSKRDTKRREAIKLVERISEHINSPLTWLYWQIRTQGNEINSNLNETITKSYTVRLRIRVASTFFFKTKNVAFEYEEIIKEIRLVRNIIINKEKLDYKEIIEFIDERKNYLSKCWKLRPNRQNWCYKLLKPL